MNTVTYYVQNDVNSNQGYQQIPISSSNSIVQQDSYLTYNNKNNDINSNEQNKAKNNAYSTERKNKNISMAEILSNDNSDKSKNNNYNNISSLSPDGLSTNGNITINNLSPVNPNSNTTEIVASDSALLYPNSFINYNYDLNNKKDISNFYEISNNIPSTTNNVTYHIMSPNTPSTDNFINNIASTTFETNNIITNQKSSTNINDMISMVPFINIINTDDNFPNANNIGNNNEINNNYFVTPLNEKNQIQVISYPLNSINTIPSTNKYIQIDSSSPNNLNINSNPSSSDKLISNYSYQNSNIPINMNKNYGNGIASFQHNNTNQYNGLSNQDLIPLNNNNLYSIQRLETSPIVSKFNIANNKIISNKKENNFNNILSKETKNFKKIVNSSSSKTESSKEGIGDFLFSKTKKYINKKFENSSNDLENGEKELQEINTNINNNKGKTEIESLGDNNYNIKSNLINNDSLEIEPDEFYSQYMFSQINKIRTDPKSFIPKIKNAIKKITNDKKNGKLIYKGRLRVSLYKGETAFTEAISDLENKEPMNPLEFKKELCVDISEDETEFKSGDYLREKIREKINDGITVRAFWRDIIKDPEINFLLMIIDDNAIRRGDKRKDILDPNMKYIGINSASLGNNFVCYTVLSDE